MWSKKWYLKRNVSCDAHLLNELLETDVPWDDAILVSAGKLRKLGDSLSELRSSLCETRLERTVLRPALRPVETAQFTQFFHQVWRHTVKSLSLSESIPLYIQQDATLHSLFISGNCSTCFEWYFQPSSGAHWTVSTASGICHTVTAICRYRGRVGTGLCVGWGGVAPPSPPQTSPTPPP
jgi:hypothetical protein